MAGDDDALGRPTIARALTAAGHASSVEDAFNRLIGHGCPAYVRREGLGPEDAIIAIRAAGGIPVLAHFRDAATRLDLIRELIAVGLAGLEVFYRSFDARDRRCGRCGSPHARPPRRPAGPTTTAISVRTPTLTRTCGCHPRSPGSLASGCDSPDEGLGSVPRPDQAPSSSSLTNVGRSSTGVTRARRARRFSASTKTENAIAA